MKSYTEVMESCDNRDKIPGIFKFGLGLTVFNTWVLFEETIVDRHGLWEYMPYYRVGHLCAWDIGAAVLIGYGLWRLFRRRETTT